MKVKSYKHTFDKINENSFLRATHYYIKWLKMHVVLKKNIYPIFSNNSEAITSELLEIIEDIFTHHC